MIDGEDQVLLEGPGQSRVGAPAGNHPEVVGSVIQVEVRLDGLMAGGQAVQGGDQSGRGRGQPDQVLPGGGGVKIP